MAEIQQSRFTQLLRRVWSLKSGFAPTLLEDIFPTFQLHDSSDPYLERLRGAKLLATGQTVTGAAGFIPALLLAVPSIITGDAGTPPGVSFDLRMLLVGNPGAQAATFTIEHGPSTTGLVGASQLTPQDGREFKSGDAADQPRSWTRVSPITATFATLAAQRSLGVTIPAAGSLVIPFRATLANGSAMLLKLGFVAGIMQVTVIGTERVFEPSENF